MKADHTISQDYVRLSRRKPVRAQPVPIQPDNRPHDHEFHEICLVTGGRAQHLTIDGQESLARGSVVVVAPGQLHGFSHTNAFAVVNVYYLAEWFLANGGVLGGIECLMPLFFQRALFLNRQPGGVAHFKLSEAELSACLHDFADLENEGNAPDAEILYLEAAFIKCLVRMARAWARGEPPASSPVILPSTIRRGLTAIDHAASTGTALDVREIARGAGASLSHFCRLFRAHTGLTAGTYFQRRRIHRACHRLLSSDDSVTEVAHWLGYADSAHFIRHFKRITQLTPGAYRQKFSEPATSLNP